MFNDIKDQNHPVNHSTLSITQFLALDSQYTQRHSSG